jgi:hypothetical protein
LWEPGLWTERGRKEERENSIKRRGETEIKEKQEKGKKGRLSR